MPVASNSLWNLKSLVNIFTACWSAWDVAEKSYSLYDHMIQTPTQGITGSRVNLETICKWPSEKWFVFFNWTCNYMSVMVSCISLYISPSDVGMSLVRFVTVATMQVSFAIWNALDYLKHLRLVKVILELFSRSLDQQLPTRNSLAPNYL